MGKSGSPVSRSNTNTCPDLVAWATASILPPVPLHREQHRGLGQVAVPEVVVDGLEVPDPLAGGGLQRDDAVSEEVGPVPVSTPEIEGGEPVGRNTSPRSLVHADPAPGVGAPRLLPGVPRATCRGRDSPGPGIVRNVQRMAPVRTS